MWDFILDCLFPIQCLGCGQEGKFVCPACFEKIPLNQKVVYPAPFSRKRCRAGLKKSPLPCTFLQNKKAEVVSERRKVQGLSGLIIASFYNNPVLKETIHQYKYNFIKDLAKPLASLMIKKLTDCPWLTSPVRNTISNGASQNLLLIPVPLHQKRLRWRGFNQAELLAQEISQQLKIPLAPDILERTKYALPQVQIKDAQERKRNIQEAFRLRPPLISDIKHQTIILVDDVCTTGATLEECAYALKKAGAKKIWGLVLARG